MISQAFVPLDKVIEVYEILKELREEEDKVTEPRFEEFIQYSESTYVGLSFGRKGAQKKPTFAINIWNKHKRILNKV